MNAGTQLAFSVLPLEPKEGEDGEGQQMHR